MPHRRIRYEGQACSESGPRMPITLKADTGRAKPLRARSPAGGEGNVSPRGCVSQPARAMSHWRPITPG